jgi:membrane protease YdiL (CAAX protease family)
MPRTHNPAGMANFSASSIWLRILACLAVVVIACGFKNYLAVLVSGTAVCPYLCPSTFPSEAFFSFPLLESLFEAQRWAREKSQAFVGLLFSDQWNLMTSLLIAPIYEELVFRGPMFLTRGRMHNYWWWLIGTVLTILFALSHGRTGLALLPLLVFGICSLWLITITHRFWPTVALHFLHNFFFSSALIYQSFLIGD